MPIPVEVESAFFAGRRAKAYGFCINDSVRIVGGPNSGAFAAVIAIRQVDPVVLFVELSDGSGVQVPAADVEFIDCTLD